MSQAAWESNLHLDHLLWQLTDTGSSHSPGLLTCSYTVTSCRLGGWWRERVKCIEECCSIIIVCVSVCFYIFGFWLQAFLPPLILLCAYTFKANPTGFLTRENFATSNTHKNHLLEHVCMTHRCLVILHGCNNFVTFLRKSWKNVKLGSNYSKNMNTFES